MQKINVKDFYKNVLNEFHCFPMDVVSCSLTNENLQKAMTVNAILNDNGYTLQPKDVIQLAQSASLNTFPSIFTSCLSSVKAEPMYPNFPKQVMEIEEATYRFHQLVYYFSVYDIEDLFDVEVSQGWLPPMEKTEKSERDERLLPYKVITLLEGESVFTQPLQWILRKKTRMTLPEQEMIFQCIELLGVEKMVEVMTGEMVGFKQNLMVLCNAILDNTDAETAVCLLKVLCQHTGDVLKVCDYSLTRHKYHFTKAQKRVWVRVLESYPIVDFRSNVVLSAKKGERAELVLRYLDYNNFSRSKLHAKVVQDLRNGKLRSWFSQLDRVMQAGDEDEILAFIMQKPGMLLRMVNQLVKNGVSMDKIVSTLIQKADALSLPTLVSVIQHFMQEEKVDIADGLKLVLEAALQTKETPLQGKKVFLDNTLFDLDASYIGRNMEGGYYHEGLAVRIPEDVKFLRFFVYWNDKKRVDIDLHSVALSNDGHTYHVGWNGHFKKEGIVTSGDITHSDAAEYIDISLENQTCEMVIPTIQVFSGGTFKNIQTCYVGMMAVKKNGEAVKLYDPANCFFTHDLRSNVESMLYGQIFPKERLLKISLRPDIEYCDCMSKEGAEKLVQDKVFSLQSYIDILCRAQGCERVLTKEEADCILSIETKEEENVTSLIDNNYFLD